VEDRQLNHLTKRIIGCAIEVHRHLGPGPLESIYESALCIELKLAGLTYERQKPVPVTYKSKMASSDIGCSHGGTKSTEKKTLCPP